MAKSGPISVEVFMEISCFARNDSHLISADKTILSINNIQNIRRDLQTDQMHRIDQDIDTSSVNIPLERFTHTSEDEVKTLIMKSPSKSCSLDLMPTWLLKLHVSELLPIITAIVNVSMDSWRVPPVFKCAQIRPLLKKPTLDPDILKNYRSVSNLPFISKVCRHTY